MEQYGKCGNVKIDENTQDIITSQMLGEPSQIMIDENTPLTNIVKIAVGKNHALALTKGRKCICMGRKYSWRTRKCK